MFNEAMFQELLLPSLGHNDGRSISPNVASLKFYETNLRQKINKSKELQKTLKSIGLPSKVVTASNICLKDKNEIVFNATKNCFILKNCFSDLAQNLVSKLPLSPNIFT